MVGKIIQKIWTLLGQVVRMCGKGLGHQFNDVSIQNNVMMITMLILLVMLIGHRFLKG